MSRRGTIRARHAAAATAAVVALGTAGTVGATTAPPDESEPAGSGAAAAGEAACTLTEPLRIGYAADFSDFGGFADQPGSEAAGVQVDLLNAAGGVGGLPVEYVVKELPEDPSGAQRAAQELLDDGVNAIIAPPFAYNGVPLIDTVDGQVPIISNASTDLQLAQPDRGAFLMSFSDPVQAAAAAEFAVGEGAATAVTFSSQVNELASMDPLPDVLYTAMIMPGAGALLEQLRAAGLDELQVIGADSFDATVIWSAGDVAEGVSFTAHTFPSDDNGVQAFLDATAEAGVEIETVSFGALASDAVKVFAHAAETACSVDGAALIEAIASISDLEVTTGTVSYAGTNGVPDRDVTILTISDGAPALTTTLRPAFIPGA